MSHYTVSADAAARSAGAINAVIASLPVSLAPGDTAADFVAIDGADGWTARAAAALAAGARGVVVIEPTAPTPADLSDLARSARDKAVVIDRSFAGNPGIGSALPAIAALDGDTDAVLEARVVVPVGADLDTVLLGQLALVRAAGSPVVTARILSRTAHGYTVRGTLDTGRPVLLTAVASDARPHSASLRLLGATDAVEIEVPSPVAARPLRTTVTTAEGAVLLPTRYETAHRASWSRVRDLAGTTSRASDLDDLAADLLVAASL